MLATFETARLLYSSSPASFAQQAKEIAPYADGIVVGSAIVKMIAENSQRSDLVAVVSQYAREMKKAISVS